jgi:hypothetical protein
LVIQAILEESRATYQAQYHQAIARLLHIPKGTLRLQTRKGKRYWYLRRFTPARGYADLYLGLAGNRDVEQLVAFIAERKQRLNELKAIKEALRQLGVRKMEFQERGYHQMFIALLEAFGKAGLWDEGLMLIGSWCFNVYAQAFGVEYYPLRTLDFDFGLRIPYRGDKADINDILINLGFSPRIDMAYDKVDYVLPGVGMVEVFIDRDKASDRHIKALKRDLAIRPAAVSYLQLLMDHPVHVKIHGVHKSITLPAMPAFFVHRLITAAFGEYRDAALQRGKIRKDYKQAALVAKKILESEDLRQKLTGLIDGLAPDQRARMMAGVAAARDFVKAPDLSKEDLVWIQKALDRPN